MICQCTSAGIKSHPMFPNPYNCNACISYQFNCSMRYVCSGSQQQSSNHRRWNSFGSLFIVNSNRTIISTDFTPFYIHKSNSVLNRSQCLQIWFLNTIHKSALMTVSRPIPYAFSLPNPSTSTFRNFSTSFTCNIPS